MAFGTSCVRWMRTPGSRGIAVLGVSSVFPMLFFTPFLPSLSLHCICSPKRFALNQMPYPLIPMPGV